MEYNIVVYKSDWGDFTRYVLVESNGLGCLFLSIYDDEDKVYLSDLQVSEPYRNKGIAKALIQKSFKIINEDLDNFFKPIVCYIREDSPEWLYEFYKRMKLEVYKLEE